MRPSGRLHIGHLHGALENWLELSHSARCFFFVADWHALTTEFVDTSVIKPATDDMVLDWLAVGVDPEKTTLFVQSAVPEHAELALLLGMITPLSWLERNPTYKEVQEETGRKDLATYGFLGYPVLQSADILAYRATHVPVGKDQLPHLELTREIARRFNHLFGDVLPEPAPLLSTAAKVPGTDGRKMSKSYGNAIMLTEEPESVEKKILTMVTDPARKRRQDPGDPDICPVFDLHKIYSSPETQKYCAEGCRTAGIGCVDCKNELLPSLHARLEPIREARAAFEQKPGRVREVLEDGNERARAAAGDTLLTVRDAMKI